MSAVERLTINGSEFVPLAELEAMQDERDNFRRTLAMAHMHLHFDDELDAVERIERDTGWTVEDANAIRSVVAWALSAPTPPSSSTSTRAGGES